MTISYVDSGGGKLAVEVAGRGPLVVCSPAMGDTRDAFGAFASGLVAQGYRVARVDLRGHGDSSALFDHYGDEATADDYLAVIESLGDESAVLAGASMSAGAAVIAAGRRPDRVAGLVLLGPFLRNRGGRAARGMLQIALAPPWGPLIWRLYAAKLWPGLGAEANERAVRTTKLLQRPGRWAAFRATTATDHSVIEPWLKRVKAPALIVMGEADPDWPDPLNEAKWVASNFGDADLLAVPGCGHAPMLERPEAVNPAVLRFLQRVSATGAFQRSDA